MRSLTGNQRMVLSWLETGPNLLATKISLAAAFWTLYRFRICSSGRPANSEFAWYRRNRTMAWTKVFTPWGVFFLFFFQCVNVQKCLLAHVVDMQDPNNSSFKVFHRWRTLNHIRIWSDPYWHTTSKRRPMYVPRDVFVFIQTVWPMYIPGMNRLG